MTADDTREALLHAAEDVVARAETDDDFDGNYIDFLVPSDAIEELRAALAAARRDPEPVASADAAWEALGAALFDSGNAGAAEVVDKHRPAIEAAIRGTAALDVERLRTAIYDTSIVHDWANTTDTVDRTDEIADRYARLADNEPS
jgi:hypothetical protein